MNEYAIIFMVKVQELPKDYKYIINDCRIKVTEYFGTRNVDRETNNTAPCIHVKCDIDRNDAIELRRICPTYVELVFIVKNGEIFVVADL